MKKEIKSLFLILISTFVTIISYAQVTKIKGNWMLIAPITHHKLEVTFSDSLILPGSVDGPRWKFHFKDDSTLILSFDGQYDLDTVRCVFQRNKMYWNNIQSNELLREFIKE